MDYETLSNCFIGVFEDVKSEEKQIFIVHHTKNDIVELVKFLQRNIDYDEWHVSFNGLSFDSQITEYIIRNTEELLRMSGQGIAEALYERAQSIITNQNNLYN